MAVSTGDILRVVAKMARAGQDILNVYHCIVEGTGIGTNLDVITQIADDLDTAYQVLVGNISSGVTFETVEGYNLSADEYLGAVGWPVLNAGTGTGNPLPVQTSPLVLFNTDTLNSQGRKFLPPMANGALDAQGTPNATILSNLGTFAAALLLGAGPGTWTAEFGNWRPLTLTFIPWTGAVVPDYFATQRRRYAGIGS